MSRSEANARRSRNILSKEQAIEIFQLKFSSSMRELRASLVAERYGVGVKAIRDIWIGRTWYRETFHMDASRADGQERLMRKIGRPSGARDLKPRARRQGNKDDATTAVEGNPQQDDKRQLLLDLTASDQTSDVKLENGNAITRFPDSSEDNRRQFPNLTLCFDDPFHDDWPYWNSVMANK